MHGRPLYFAAVLSYLFLPRSIYAGRRVWRRDRRTERILIARPRLHPMQRGKTLLRRQQIVERRQTWHGMGVVGNKDWRVIGRLQVAMHSKLPRFLVTVIFNKKLIRRWDSERELSLRRHCTRTCINSATDGLLQRRFTKFTEITQCNSHYAVHGHSRSPILVPIESPYTTSY